MFQFLGAATQVACLPYADLTLIATNCTFAIIFIQVLAIIFLGEQFSWRHDFNALIFLSAGTILMLKSSNIEGRDEHTDRVIDILLTWRTVVSAAICLTFWVASQQGQ
jgi:drug/metabolite transporter (DMT)-like permease